MTPIYIGVALFILFLACGRFYDSPPARQIKPELDGTYTLLRRGRVPVKGFRTCTAAHNYTEETINA